MAETPTPRPSAEDRKAERARATLARLEAVAAAAKDLDRDWDASGFYDRQPAAQALALHEALIAYESGETT